MFTVFQVSYAAQDLKADVILDIATLTGAQGVATGRHHGALLTNQPEWEEFSVSAGRASADLVHPMIYCPELHFTEFSSCIADMKNSSAVSRGEGGGGGVIQQLHTDYVANVSSQYLLLVLYNV